MRNALRVLGCDPGVTGAICVYSPHATVPIQPDGLIDLPTYTEGDHTSLIDGWALRDWVRSQRPNVGFVEKVNAMPSIPDKKTGQRRSMGATSAFNFGRNYQIVRDVIVFGCEVPLYTVTSIEWKKVWGLKGGLDDAKELSRQAAIRHFGCAVGFLDRKKDHNRAEALLIAAYGAMQENFETREWA